MRICVIGGANADIIATSFGVFVPNDSNPGSVRLTAGGVGRNIAHNLALLGYCPKKCVCTLTRKKRDWPMPTNPESL